MKSTCGTKITLSKQTIYDIMTGKLSMKFVQDEKAAFDYCGLCCCVCCVCGCGCVSKIVAQQDRAKEERIQSMSEKELLAEIVRNQGR